ncbi:MAG: hypothetical protein IJE46_05430 [Clostridia bacterium]|nr:hypothetical protein [Clostridia bacterium]
MTERIKNMVDYILKKTIYPEAKEIKYDRADYLLSERLRATKRLCEYMLAQDVTIPDGALMVGMIKFDKCPYPSDFMRKVGFKHTGEILDNFFDERKGPFEDFKFWGWQHATADFGKFIEFGVEGIKEQIHDSLKKYSEDEDKVDFLNACLIMCDGIIAWENKCADECYKRSLEETDPERKQQLLKMSENLKRVPRYPATNFYEALQSLYFCFDFLSDSLGLPDRWLYKYYKQDIADGTITEDFAKDLLQELFVRVQSCTPIHGNFTKGGESNFSLGGYTIDGEDGYNELSELIINSLLELPLYIPQITFRWTKKTPFELLYHIMDLGRKDPHQRVAFVNDDVKIECLMKNCDVPWEEAINYVTIGCNMIALSGGLWYGTGYANQVKALDNTLYTRREDIIKAKDFDEFYKIYEEELHKALSRDQEVGNRLHAYASKDECILGSLFMTGCIEKGVSMHKGGASGFSEMGGGVGLMCTIDSLAIFKQFVYDEKIVSAEKMLDALEANWEGYEYLYSMIMKNGKFFGNDYESSDDVARLVTTSINNFAKTKTDLFGKHYIGVIAPGYREYHKWFGAITGATPDGRYKGDPFKTIGAGQTEGRDREGLTALLNSVAKYDPTRHFAGVTVTNINVDSALIYNDDNFVKTVKLIETYFRNGGAQIQINSVSREDLVAAKENPEKYKSLRVRVSGFSEYFVNLKESIKDNIIERTVQK